MAQGIGTKTSASGIIKRQPLSKKGTPQFSIRVDDELAQRFRACVIIEAKIHNLDPVESRVFRSLMRMYCDRVEATNESPEAKQAAKVLRKKVS